MPRAGRITRSKDQVRIETPTPHGACTATTRLRANGVTHATGKFSKTRSEAGRHLRFKWTEFAYLLIVGKYEDAFKP